LSVESLIVKSIIKRPKPLNIFLGLREYRSKIESVIYLLIKSKVQLRRKTKTEQSRGSGFGRMSQINKNSSIFDLWEESGVVKKRIK
jgi:hypothetical protein